MNIRRLLESTRRMSAWADRAACQDADPELFFPTRGESTKEAKRICRDCPVRNECLEHAIEFGERFGIWGGRSERERRRLVAKRREMRQGAAA